MSDKPLMKCGHAANATCSASGGVIHDPPIPSCCICDCLEVAAPPNLVGRIAKCTYKFCRRKWEKRRDTHYGEFGPDGQSFAPSSTNLPFFQHHPGKPFDEYCCGCFGWD